MRSTDGFRQSSHGDGALARPDAGVRRASCCSVGLFGLIGLVSGGLGAGLATLVGPTHADAAAALQLSRQSGATGTSTGIDVAAVAKAVEPAVVDVDTVVDPLEGGGSGAGTGMILGPSGYIVTNNHVVQDADSVTVKIPGHGTHPARVIGTDPSADVAVLKVSGLAKLATVVLANSTSAVVGTPVVAIGNALGLGGRPTVAEGTISAVGRTITAANDTGSGEETLHGLLQTDAPIGPGNSGGPLVDAKAQVLGMDTATASAGTSGASLGFAIPSNTVAAVAHEIEHHDHLPGLVFGRQAFLGVEVVDSSEIGNGSSPFGSFGNSFSFGSGLGFGFGPVVSTPNGTPGVVVAAVDPNSPAATAGIESGEVITALDGHATPTTAALSKLIRADKPGQVIQVTLYTTSGVEHLSLRLAAGPID
jgi:S1-C subfamily serine protease